MIYLRPLAPVLLLVLAGGAKAQLTPPTLQKGQFVYALPDGFSPPLIERAGMAEMDRELGKLKFPFYVILTDDLPGGGQLANLSPNSPEYNRLRAKLADDAAINLTNRLRAQSKFDQNRASVFLLTFKPKSFTYRPGSEWKTKYGFVTDAHKPYIDLFKRYASNPANDPKQGILEMAKAIDAHLDDLSNPAKIAARALAVTQGRFDSQLADSKRILSEAQSLGIPADGLADAIHRAESVRKADSTALDKATAALKGLTDTARGPVEQKRAERQAAEQARRDAEEAKRRQEAAEQTRRSALFILGGLLVVGSGVGIAARRRRYADLRSELDRSLATNRERIANARQQAFRLFEERDAIAGAAKFQGRTREIYDRVAADLDALTLGLEAMAGHADATEREAATANLLDVSPLEKAIRNIDEPFDFDTGTVNRENLYGDPTKRVKVTPRAFATETSARFAGTSVAWEKLKTALELRGKTPEGELPHSRLDELQKEAADLGLEPRWFDAHPLTGDEASDQAAYAALGDLIWRDPVAGLEKIEEIRGWEADAAQAFVRIRGAEADLNGARLTEVPAFSTAPVAPGDDPATLLGYAQEAETAFRHTLTSSLSTEEIAKAAEEATLSYNLCREAIESLRRAVTTAEQEIAALGEPLAAVQRRLNVAEETLVDTAHRHRGIGTARSLLSDAQLAAKAAEADADGARQALASNRHLEAARRAKSSRGHIEGAEDKCKGAIGICDDLEQARARYEAKLREMGAIQSSLDHEASRYGARNILTPLQTPYLSGPSDYGLLYGLLSQQQDSWHQSVDSARVAYEAQQTAQSQSDSSSWSSSDSSSSFSSGDSGGGFSDSGGSSGDSSGGW
ncbi:hypothetical protein BH11ARM2_BH11ARM2_06690 [soil metagenome]